MFLAPCGYPTCLLCSGFVFYVEWTCYATRKTSNRTTNPRISLHDMHDRSRICHAKLSCTFLSSSRKKICTLYFLFFIYLDSAVSQLSNGTGLVFRKIQSSENELIKDGPYMTKIAHFSVLEANMIGFDRILELVVFNFSIIHCIH